MRGVTILTLAFAAIALACGPNEKSCGGQCYNPTTTVCLQDINNLALCPIGLQVCNGACYNPASYHCTNGALQGGPAPATPSTTAAAKASTSSTTSTTKASTSSTSSTTSAIKASTSSTKVPTTSSSTTSTSSTTSAPTTSAAVSCSVMWSTLTCRTKSQNPAAVDSNNVASSRSWLCSSYPLFCSQINPGGQFASCNTVEQLSYAMTQYYNSVGPSQGASACSFSGIAVIVGASTTSSSTTAAAATPTTSASAPVVAPAPAPVAGNSFPAQTADLRIINNCKSQLWFEARYGGAGAPLPGQSATSVQALPGSYVDYVIPDTGLSGTRFWAKYGCDNKGQNCLIGDQMQYFPNPPGGCPPGGCTPPVDSLFEATWGCRPGSDCNSQNPTTWFDTSQVDGWTIPYKLTPVGDVSGCDCNGPNCGFKGVDASTLDVAKCPNGEDLSAGGQFLNVSVAGKTVGLNSVDLRIINNGQILGCMSPCKRLNWGYPYGLQQDEGHGSTMWMCCPTPNPSNCLPSEGCITPTACRAGPIENTQYVAAVHNMAPGVYSYSYDDGVGLHACPAGVTKYTMEFCPAGSATYPGKA